MVALGFCGGTQAFSSCREQGLTLCCRAQALGVRAPWLGCIGSVALRHVESSWIRAQTHVPCISGRILTHCPTREALNAVISVSNAPFWLNLDLSTWLAPSYPSGLLKVTSLERMPLTDIAKYVTVLFSFAKYLFLPSKEFHCRGVNCHLCFKEPYLPF